MVGILKKKGESVKREKGKGGKGEWVKVNGKQRETGE